MIPLPSLAATVSVSLAVRCALTASATRLLLFDPNG